MTALSAGIACGASRPIYRQYRMPPAFLAQLRLDLTRPRPLPRWRRPVCSARSHGSAAVRNVIGLLPYSVGSCSQAIGMFLQEVVPPPPAWPPTPRRGRVLLAPARRRRPASGRRCSSDCRSRPQRRMEVVAKAITPRNNRAADTRHDEYRAVLTACGIFQVANCNRWRQALVFSRCHLHKHMFLLWRQRLSMPANFLIFDPFHAHFLPAARCHLAVNRACVPSSPRQNCAMYSCGSVMHSRKSRRVTIRAIPRAIAFFLLRSPLVFMG